MQKIQTLMYAEHIINMGWNCVLCTADLETCLKMTMLYQMYLH